MTEWNRARVLIVGAARQGLALARYLAGKGASVILTDQRSEQQMQVEMQAMSGLNVSWALGGHPLSLLDGVELVCVSGGVPLDLQLVAAARKRGIPLSNDSQIFMEAVPCPVIGITGSSGKTTTTSLVGRMAQAAVLPPHQAWVGGNIGTPLVDQLDNIRAGDLVVLELSSFQLELMTCSPQVAAVLNVTPNHLDRHGTLAAYTAAKARILDYQQPQDTAVLNRDDPGSWNLGRRVAGETVSFGFRKPAFAGRSAYLEEETICWGCDGAETPVLLRDEILLRGEHNLSNVLAACAIALAAGFAVQAVRDGVRGFKGVAHRLEFVRTWNGTHWYNDSIATAPERTKAALLAFDEPMVLLLGGRDKNLPWDDLAELIRQRVDHVIAFGEAADLIVRAIGRPGVGGRPYSLVRCAGLEQAVQAAAETARPGDVILLSPGGTSFDEFKDFEARGEAYRLWVNKLQ